MTSSLLVTFLWLFLPASMVIGALFIRRAFLNGDWCDVCGAKFDPTTAMPCHSDDGKVWAYKWTSEEAMLRAYFPDGHFVEGTLLYCGGVCDNVCRFCENYDNYVHNRKD